MSNAEKPALSGKRRGTWRVGRQENHRPYDPKIDGWHRHKLRREPTVDELLAKLDEPLGD